MKHISLYWKFAKCWLQCVSCKIQLFVTSTSTDFQEVGVHLKQKGERKYIKMSKIYILNPHSQLSSKFLVWNG